MPGGLYKCERCGEMSVTIETLSCWNCDKDTYSSYSYTSSSSSVNTRTCNYCSRVISEWEYSQNNGYCSSHKNGCQFAEGCSERVSYGYCSRHTFEEQVKIYKSRWENATRERDNFQAQLNNRPNITNQQYNNLLQEQRNLQAKRDELQGQLNTANGQVRDLQTRLDNLNRLLELKRQEIDWLKNQLRTNLGNREYECKVEFNYPPQFKNN